MTKEEIKQSLSMREVLERYGIRIDRKGFCCCPFHKEKTASMKIYKDSYHCFGCGSGGDIFSFVQKIDSCDFKTAFKTLGGTYERKSNFEHKKFKYQIEKRKETQKKKAENRELQRISIIKEIDQQQLFKKMFPPMSDDWCDSVNKLEILYHRLETIITEKR